MPNPREPQHKSSRSDISAIWTLATSSTASTEMVRPQRAIWYGLLGSISAKGSGRLRAGYVVVPGFLQGGLLAQTCTELRDYIENVIPTKDPEEHYFDGEWSAAGSRGPPEALKYINIMTETPFFAAFRCAYTQQSGPMWAPCMVVCATRSGSAGRLVLTLLARLPQRRPHGRNPPPMARAGVGAVRERRSASDPAAPLSRVRSLCRKRAAPPPRASARPCLANLP
eukprot:SAG11_NODE_3892_length_2163_cov_0.859981_3_plen_226_part_00